MTAAKTNERPGTRAKVSHIRSSAFKAREILDLIRGKSYSEASEILDFSERGISHEIKKVLDSAVANAEHNDSQIAEELFISACYADEGPTLKRFRPRARGRAGRILKRTCHITVIVSRFDETELEKIRERESASGRSGSAQAASSRRDRVERSRARAEAKAAADDSGDQGQVDQGQVDEGQDSIGDTDEIEFAPEGPYGPMSADATEDGSIPDGFEIKGKLDSKKYHQPGGRWYDTTDAEVYFATAEAAEVSGFTEAGSKSQDSEEIEDGDDNVEDSDDTDEES